MRALAPAARAALAVRARDIVARHYAWEQITDQYESSCAPNAPNTPNATAPQPEPEPEPNSHERERARVHAVAVSYRSDPERLARQFERLLQQVSAIVWVDNASDVVDAGTRWPAERLHPIWLDDNLGIGTAQNRGMFTFDASAFRSAASVSKVSEKLSSNTAFSVLQSHVQWQDAAFVHRKRCFHPSRLLFTDISPVSPQ